MNSEIKSFYEEKMYGFFRSGETVDYSFEGEKLTIFIQKDDKRASFSASLFLPEPEIKAAAAERFGGRIPIIISMHPIGPKDYALSKGYAVMFLNTLQVASDDMKHEGCFYELYPYGSNPDSQTGVLMAWAWAASKALDALKNGLGRELLIDAEAAIVTGVSRWGKATAVCGAFDERFAMTMPACSGAGGLALNCFVSEGLTYDFSKIGGPKEYTYGQNEPLGCLQSEAERGWFNDYFLNFKSVNEIPFEQYMLPVMAASPERLYFIIAACMGEDWVNAPSMWECYKAADRIYSERGLEHNLAVHFHREGHAVLEEDLKLAIPFFNRMHYGIDEQVDFDFLKTSVFEGQDVIGKNN